ncbi:diguanylate cyclase (GGDEF) domain-containing protein [Pseudobutyrivibrio sp. YE44]|uniref:GGDEF domain-containing protein n=1 Tax=Pseudobutyrivibrio sp. YE44 TaxID=1520802 RepID=UPI0008906A79|nr:GGDEF domain-containing protein [Pseudobutyrivibrio sp. YE44]SDB24474.1 diguanylate cyclase (GGDEF) domain-containing protein [Pseudobutyrivibrio sp. YE44]
MSRQAIKRIIQIIVFVLAALLLLQSLYFVAVKVEKGNNHEKVTKLINEDLKFSWDTMDSELALINDYIQNKHLTNADLGRLYERAALIYMQKGETMSYYRYLGYALYYLEKSDEKDYTINVYLDLANFFLNNYAYENAYAMMDKAQAIRPFDEIQSLQIKSYAYRMLGIMELQKLNYNEAETYFLDSQRILENSNTGIFEESYLAMSDVWLARVYEETGRLPKCKEILDKWDGNDMFTTDVYRKIFLRDFIIPYYQAKCYYLCAENIKERSNPTTMDSDAREQAVLNYLNEFMTLCSENDYEKAELYTLLKIQREYPTKNEAIREKLYTILDELYRSMFNQQNLTYAGVIDDMVQDSMNEMRNNEYIEKQRIKRTELTLVVGGLLGLLILTFIILLMNSRFDGLTKLLTRKVFNHDITCIKRSNIPYGIIMIDIDDFKHVNDTYGHPEGDIVLWRLGQLISKETTADIKGYRYGGEEFIIMVTKSALPYVPKIAERLRDYMEQQGWEFAPDLVITLSVGTATGQGGDEVVKQADENLYHSKQNGKNQVTNS